MAPDSDISNVATSGHHAPNFDLIAPFDTFPTKINGPTVWDARDYRNAPSSWQHVLTAEQIQELSDAADRYQSQGLALTDMSKAYFRLSPDFESQLAQVRKELIDGRGFILFKGFPTKTWSIDKVATAYMGLGSHIGNFVSQNGKGHILGHVKDLGYDATQTDKVRIYATNARQFFHTDTCDVVGLLCLHRARSGGESDIVSSHRIYNILHKERPDVLETLSRPIWYFDRKGEHGPDQLPYFKAAVVYNYKGRVILHWDPYYVTSLKRFWESGELPPLSEAQQEAIKVLEDTCLREALHMILEVGDVQFVSCNHVLHARTAYVDHPPPAPRRQLMRLWLATSESSGGWPIPFPDSDHPRRMGITIGNAHTSPLEAE